MNDPTDRNKIGCLPALADDEGGDNIAIALASYFDGHSARPKNDPEDTELGWGVWVIEKTNDALDRITATLSNAPRQPEPASGDRLHADVGGVS